MNAPRLAGRWNWAVALLPLALFPARGATLVLTPAADAVVYEQPTTSNGAGQFLLAGRTNQSIASRRRSLIHFDLSPVPAGAQVTDAVLQLHLFEVTTATTIIHLHRVTTAWTTGPSNPDGNESAGVAATIGDVTWEFASFDHTLWSTPGGDTSPTPSSSQSVGSTMGVQSWSGPDMLSDLADWLARPDENFGWALRDDETTPQTAKRFASADHSDISLRPRLTLTYTPIPEPATGSLLGIAIALRILVRSRTQRAPLSEN